MVTLLGGGALGPGDLALALSRAPVLAAADGGADGALAEGYLPEAVIGDFDSISPEARARIPADRQHVIAEQDSTDFDKTLRNVAAPLVLGLGLTGARVDHELAALTTLARRAGQPCVLLGGFDIVFLAPPALSVALPAGTRLSLYPLGPVSGTSQGLRWPIEGLDFAPAGPIGTSNAVAAPELRLAFDAPAMLVILPRDCLDAVLGPVAAAGGWPGVP